VLLIQNLLKKKKIAKNASIVFVSSVVALTGLPSTSLYAASKAALNSYARVLASELAPQRIRVNCISPGIIKTNFIEREGVISASQLTTLEDQYPFGFGEPEDISSIIMFLLSDDSKWITGTNIVIDGGYMLQ
jgi:NAD(P)-dependent dehydrogenase (short-subunit alcohol dehydrogenase family)